MSGIIKVVTMATSAVSLGDAASPLSYWRARSNRQVVFRCPVNGCSHFVETGTVVRRMGTMSNGLYVMPVCRQHGVEGRILAVPAVLTLVPAAENACLPRAAGF